MNAIHFYIVYLLFLSTFWAGIYRIEKTIEQESVNVQKVIQTESIELKKAIDEKKTKISLF